MKHDIKIKHWLTLLPILIKKHDKLFEEYLKLDNYLEIIDYKSHKKLFIRNHKLFIQTYELNERINRIQSQLNQP